MKRAILPRRVKRTAVAVAAVAGILFLGAQLPGDADAAIDPLAPYSPLSDTELSQLRGGFHANGFNFDFGISVIIRTFVEDSDSNMLGLITKLNFNGKGGIGSFSTEIFGGGGGIVSNGVQDDEEIEVGVSNDETNVIHTLGTTSFQSLLQTEGSSQNIIQEAEFNFFVPSSFQTAIQSFAQTVPTLRNLARHIGLSSLGMF